MYASFDDARNQMATAFNDLADSGFTKQQMEAAESLRKILQLMLLMSCSKCPNDCHDLSDTVQLKSVRLGKGQ